MAGRQVVVGVVGLGRLGAFHDTNLATRVPAAELVRIVDVNENIAGEIAEKIDGIDYSTDYSDVLKDTEIQAVVITTNTPTHARLVEAAVAAGKHVFCERFVSLDVETLRTTELARAAGIKLQVGLHRRFDPDHRAVYEKIAAGELGDVYFFRSSSRDMRPPDLRFIENSDGIFADLSLHDIDQARWFLDDIEQVAGQRAALADLGLERVGDVDHTVITSRFAGGALGIIDNSRVAGYGYECSSEVVGSRATLRIAANRRSTVETLVPENINVNLETEPQNRFATAYVAEIEAFVNVVISDGDPEVTSFDDAAALNVARAAERSHQENRIVRLTHEARDDVIIYRDAGDDRSSVGNWSNVGSIA